MFDKIIYFSIKNKAIIGFLVLFLIGFGVYSVTDIPIDAVPDITNNQVQVVTVSPSLSPQEVEKFITYPLEVTMANITDVTEIRSVSRYGLSVVTIVFRERVPILDARQLVSEQIQMARAEIPDILGTPEMLPITTGLGEVFQYTLEVEDQFRHDYTPTDLRTIHDWIVKRQLSGIPGIVEISSFGGNLKQYEIAVDPLILKNLEITISDVFEALEKNNENTGGSYIEKGRETYYIRAEGLLESLGDIENIVVKNTGNSPVLIKNIAQVKFGHAPRFGAMTKDGKGEAVGGITLMLKGANSSEVIREVKSRVEEVQKSLPEGVYIKPYLDRAALVKRTIGTVTENLVLGGLIVIFILVLLLGHLRSGLIVASVIPLSLLFAFILMRAFGVSANLMSLGAIDFGIVIDGAVIIVENIVHRVYKYFNGQTLSQKELDKEVGKASTSIYKSAAFGVIIILIVFIPIMTLTGIEGKTFKPMAQTFSFAILGAFLLSLTYVPMMSALFLKNKVEHKRNFSDKIIDFLKFTYMPVLRLSLNFKYILLATALGVTGVTFWAFTKMGGEFLPVLEEGDLAMQMTIPPGSSLTQSIQSSTKAEKILIQEFPEVISVVSKIGTAEVPTDPMAIEDADIMIVLKPKKEWTSAETRDELIEKMKNKLSAISEASFEFTQPIQLRFNELMTGVKTDVAVKIYGEDLDELFLKANEAAEMIRHIDGASDIKVEQITGLPQYVITYDRGKIARYGINISDLNDLVRTSFAGKAAGVVFEGERKFDLVVRLDSAYRNNIIPENLFIRSIHGHQVPLSEVADIRFVSGPAQISRDNTKRRVTIGINVRNRDVESVVRDINSILSRSLDLKPGYYLTYGGQFENLENARKRLKLAVPLALTMILILLFFAFNSVKYALLIFTAVPLSTVGGIIALIIRGMPFSISAGVGFIALFGVAVLNGIVLISYLNELKEGGRGNLREIIFTGASNRLRPVMMTAITDVLGFLPMAVSTSAGAEVQQPLATVVIGGLITSTLLTMILLPVLYMIVNDPPKIKRKTKLLSILPVVILLIIPKNSMAQDPDLLFLDFNNVAEEALKNNLDYKNALLNVDLERAGILAGMEIPSTEFNFQYGQINSAVKDRYWEINQDFGRILSHVNSIKYSQTRLAVAETEMILSSRKVSEQALKAYNDYQYAKSLLDLFRQQERYYEKFLSVNEARFEKGETDILEKSLMENKYQGLVSMKKNVVAEVELNALRLKNILMTDREISTPDEYFPVPLTWLADSLVKESYELISEYTDLMVLGAERNVRLERSSFFPGLSAGYFNQQIDAVTGFDGWQVGLTFPLVFVNRSAKLRQSVIEKEILGNNMLKLKKDAEAQLLELSISYVKTQEQYKIYSDVLAFSSDRIFETAVYRYEKGEINYFDFISSIESSFEIKRSYLNILHQYNQLAIRLNYYTPVFGQK